MLNKIHPNTLNSHPEIAQKIKIFSQACAQVKYLKCSISYYTGLSIDGRKRLYRYAPSLYRIFLPMSFCLNGRKFHFPFCFLLAFLWCLNAGSGRKYGIASGTVAARADPFGPISARARGGNDRGRQRRAATGILGGSMWGHVAVGVETKRYLTKKYTYVSSDFFVRNTPLRLIVVAMVNALSSFNLFTVSLDAVLNTFSVLFYSILTLFFLFHTNPGGRRVSRKSDWIFRREPSKLLLLHYIMQYASILRMTAPRV